MATVSVADRTYRYVDPLAMPSLAVASLAGPEASAGAYVEYPGADRTFFRYAPEFIDDPDETRLFADFPSPVYVSAPNFVTSVPDASVVGYRTVLSDGTFHTDQAHGARTEAFLINLAKPGVFENEDTQLRPTASPDCFTLEGANRPVIAMEQPAINLTSVEPSNYGSFLFRVLPKVYAMREHGLLGLPVIAYIGNKAYSSLLELSGISAANIVHHDTHTITSAPRLITPSLRNPDAFLDSQSRELFDRIVRSLTPGTGMGGKLYISRAGHARRGGSSRVMVNESTLIERLVAAGFAILEPEMHSPEEQVRAFSSATMIVGPSGGGMFNTVFCQPGTKVIDIESEADWIYAHAGLFASNFLRYGLFVGKADPSDPSPVHRRWHVNVDALLDRVSDFAKS